MRALARIIKKNPGAIVVAAGARHFQSAQSHDFSRHKVMTNLSISRWARKRSDRPRFYVTDGREPLGVIFQARGIYTAVDSNGRLVVASTAFQIAANALTARAS